VVFRKGNVFLDKGKHIKLVPSKFDLLSNKITKNLDLKKTHTEVITKIIIIIIGHAIKVSCQRDE
jgi:hypothetical protein